MSTQSYKTTTKPAVVAFVTTPSTEVAKKIANVLLENKLCACVNIVPGITSLYTWKGKIEEDQENLMVIKTTAELTKEMKETIVKNHPYEVCEVITMDIVDGNEKYLDWIQNSTKNASTTNK